MECREIVTFILSPAPPILTSPANHQNNILCQIVRLLTFANQLMIARACDTFLMKIVRSRCICLLNPFCDMYIDYFAAP